MVGTRPNIGLNEMGAELKEISCESRLNVAGSVSYPEIFFWYRNVKFGIELNRYNNRIMGLYEKTISLWAYLYIIANTYYTQKYERI
jgi:hypothetical protein